MNKMTNDMLYNVIDFSSTLSLIKIELNSYGLTNKPRFYINNKTRLFYPTIVKT